MTDRIGHYNRTTQNDTVYRPAKAIIIALRKLRQSYACYCIRPGKPYAPVPFGGLPFLPEQTLRASFRFRFTDARPRLYL